MYSSIHNIKKIVTKKSTRKDKDGNIDYRTVSIKAIDKDDNKVSFTFFVTEDCKLLDSFDD